MSKMSVLTLFLRGDILLGMFIYDETKEIFEVLSGWMGESKPGSVEDKEFAKGPLTERPLFAVWYRAMPAS